MSIRATPEGRPLRVLIDAHMVGERESGNERYVLSLLRGLAELDDPALRMTVAVADPAALGRAFDLPPSWSVVPVSRAPWRRLLVELPRLAARERADLLHVTYAAPPRSPCPVAVTVHDISYVPHPEWFSRRDRWVLRAGVGFTLPRARGVVTISRHAAEAIASHYRVASDRIVVTPLAADPLFTPPGEDRIRRDLAALGLASPYVLAVGNLQPRKNLRRLVEAFGRFRQATGLPHRLVIAGKAQWQESQVFAAIRSLGLESAVTFPGYVPDPDLVSLYAGAAVFVYPSLYEGFGLPILEAMACGAPVIASNTTSMPEVAGDAALLIDPTATEALARALDQVARDPGLAGTLRRKGAERARAFSWRQTARLTLQAYRQWSRPVS